MIFNENPLNKYRFLVLFLHSGRQGTAGSYPSQPREVSGCAGEPGAAFWAPLAPHRVIEFFAAGAARAQFSLVFFLKTLQYFGL